MKKKQSKNHQGQRPRRHSSGRRGNLVVVTLLLVALLFAILQAVQRLITVQSPIVGSVPLPEAVSPSGSRTTEQTKSSSLFATAVAANQIDLAKVCPNRSPYASILQAYGAEYLATGVKLPPLCILDFAQTEQFQKAVPFETATISGLQITLQKKPMEELQAAIQEARSKGLSLDPSSELAALRNYRSSVNLFQKYLLAGLNYWVERGQIDQGFAKSVAIASPLEQLQAVLELEKRKLYLHASKHSISILNLVAPPGASQHLWGVAVDVTQHEDPRIRSILAAHGFFQTVESDFTHFTYLGRKPEELEQLGLRRNVVDGRDFFVPAL